MIDAAMVFRIAIATGEVAAMADYIGALKTKSARRSALAQVPEALRGRVSDLVTWDYEVQKTGKHPARLT